MAEAVQDTALPGACFRIFRAADRREAPKQPYPFELSSGGPFAFAGLRDAEKDKEEHWLRSCAIVTTEANELMSGIYSRMPVILHARD